jgi:hypothetical protein
LPSATSSSTYSSAALSRAARRISCCVATQRASRAPRCSDRAARRAGIATRGRTGSKAQASGKGCAIGWRFDWPLRRRLGFWHLHVENVGTEPVRVDLLLLQDLGLAPYGALRTNEYYVSQYLDHAPLEHAGCGIVIASRQNQPVGTRNPWCIVGSLNRAVGYATDALQVHGLASRAGALPPVLADELPSLRLQHEHAMAALQDGACDLAPAPHATSDGSAACRPTTRRPRRSPIWRPSMRRSR